MQRMKELGLNTIKDSKNFLDQEE